LQATGKKELSDNVAVINATDLSPIIENTEVKEIREVVGPEHGTPREISFKVAELPTTTPIEVGVPFTLCGRFWLIPFHLSELIISRNPLILSVSVETLDNCDLYKYSIYKCAIFRMIFILFLLRWCSFIKCFHMTF